MKKRFEGRDEPILDSDLPIIDAHHHLFERPGVRYLHEDYLADAHAGHKVIASVYMEILAMARVDGPELLRPLGEVEFANGVGAIGASGHYGPCRIAAGIVGYADLRLGARVGELLDRYMAAASDRIRGVRQVTIEHDSEAPYRFITHRPPRGVMKAPGFDAGFAELGRRGLVFDSALFHTQIPELATLAGRFPDTPIVLNHTGQVMALDFIPQERAETFELWKRNMAALARHENVSVKIGGFGLPFWDFGFMERDDPVGYLELAETWKPWVETTIEIFGAGRCMMESNFPQDGRSCGFVPLWNALKHLTRGCSAEERAALFHGTAARVYRLDLQALLRAATSAKA